MTKMSTGRKLQLGATGIQKKKGVSHTILYEFLIFQNSKESNFIEKLRVKSFTFRFYSKE